MSMKEEQLVIQLRGLEEDNYYLEKEMADLECRAMEEVKMTEAWKELEEMIHELMGEVSTLG